MANLLYFISYSTVDGKDLALYICEHLHADALGIDLWIDKYNLREGKPWDIQIRDAIRDSQGLIFLMTEDSVEEVSVCYQEWTLALKYKKVIIPLLLSHTLEIPFRLHQRQFVDFSGDFGTGLTRLREHLIWLSSPSGELQRLKDQLADAKHDLRRVRDNVEEKRIRTEIKRLTHDISRQELIVANPHEIANANREQIKQALEHERYGFVSLTEKRNRFINPPPAIAPSYFQDRHLETRLVGDFLKDDSVRIILLVGRGGVGKTAMVCRLLKSLEGNTLPDDGGKLEVGGIIYLSERGSRRIRFSSIFSDLLLLLPENARQELDKIYRNPQIPTETKVHLLVSHFRDERIILLLDNFEDIVDPETRAITDNEVEKALFALLTSDHHLVNTIITTRIAPRDLALLQPQYQRRIDLDRGLPSPYAENILRAMDFDGTVGLKEASTEILEKAQDRTGGHPRALEALFAIMSADRETSLEEILSDTKNILPENVVDVLVGEAFNRLDPASQRVMQALAVYNRPVTPLAIDYLLQPFLTISGSTNILNRLVNMHFVRKEEGRYFLHPLDRDYAYNRVEIGEVLDRQREELPFTQYGLLHRAADYFKEIRKPKHEWNNLGDLMPQLNEFELRVQGLDYDTAFEVLREIDYEYLVVWGYYRESVHMNERIQGKLGKLQYQQINWTNLGHAFAELGPLQSAIDYFSKALPVARELNDRWEESALLGGIASTYKEMGNYYKAIEFHEQALQVAYEVNHTEAISANLGETGFCYRSLGQVDKAIDYYSKALEVDQNTGNKSDEGAALRNLGICYRLLGDTAKALSYLNQALEICRSQESRRRLTLTLSATAHTLLDNNDLAQAIELATEALQIADAIGAIRAQNESGWILALCYLYQGDLQTALDYIEQALKYDYPRNNHNTFVALGVVLFRQGKRYNAQKAFEKSIENAEEMISYASENFEAWYAKALSACGLFLCEHNEYLQVTTKAFQNARAINSGIGVIRQGIRLFDALTYENSDSRIKDIRNTITTPS